MNLIDFEPLEFLKAETATFFQVFQDVQLMFGSDQQMPKLVSPKAAQVEGRYSYSHSELQPFVAGVEPLRDDFAPVDQLRTPADY